MSKKIIAFKDSENSEETFHLDFCNAVLDENDICNNSNDSSTGDIISI